MAITSNPKLKIDETGEERVLYFDGKTERKRDDKVQHNIPGREGDIEQDMGSGSRVIEGQLFITDSFHPDGVDGYEQFLKDAAGSDGKLTFTEDDGSTTFKCSLEEPTIDKSTDITPNLLRADVVIRELNPPPESV